MKINSLCIAILLLVLPNLANTQESTKKLVILHTNDLHSRLNGYAPEIDYSPETINDDNTIGGFARIATLIQAEREKYSGQVLVLDAGDFLMGTLFHALEQQTGFQLPLMKKMGYDVVGMGNHEFDFGPGALAAILKKSLDNGPLPMLTLSNIVFSEKDTTDDRLKEQFDCDIVRPYQVIEKNGLRIGIFGILGYVAIHDAPLSRPVEFKDPLKTAKEMTALLREREKVDLVICLSHSGLGKDASGNWIGEDVSLAQKVPGIDVIVSGHTHTLIDKPLVVNGVPIVQTGAYGAGLGRLELEISQGKVMRSDAKVMSITDAIAASTVVQQAIFAQEKLISESILAPLGLEYSSVIAETSFPLVCNEGKEAATSNLGMLIADAIKAFVNEKSPEGAGITLFPAGMVRDNIVPGKTGKQSVADLFRVVSLGSGNDGIPGYPLARVYVTGKELKGIMEVLYLAPSSSPDNYMYFGGLDATFNPEKGLLKKITSMKTLDEDGKDYVEVDWSKQNSTLYSLTANTYLLEFIGIIKKLSKGLVKVTLKDVKGNPIHSINQALIDADPSAEGVQGVKEWMALLWYLQQQPDMNGNGIPDIPETYRTGSPRLHR
jgi:5'-nucleotidase